MFRVVSVMPNKSKTEANMMTMPMALEHPQMKQPSMDMNDHGSMKMQDQEQ